MLDFDGRADLAVREAAGMAVCTFAKRPAWR
jgi:hypothetical protein